MMLLEKLAGKNVSRVAGYLKGLPVDLNMQSPDWLKDSPIMAMHKKFQKIIKKHQSIYRPKHKRLPKLEKLAVSVEMLQTPINTLSKNVSKVTPFMSQTEDLPIMAKHIMKRPKMLSGLAMDTLRGIEKKNPGTWREMVKDIQNMRRAGYAAGGGKANATELFSKAMGTMTPEHGKELGDIARKSRDVMPEGGWTAKAWKQKKALENAASARHGFSLAHQAKLKRVGEAMAGVAKGSNLKKKYAPIAKIVKGLLK